jgi:ketosteroid isomerase-like protein
MSFDPVKALVAYHAALDAHDVNLVETMMAENATYISAAVGVVEGRAAIVGAMRRYFAAHSDHHAWDDAVKAIDTNKAHAVWQLKATNNGSGITVHRRGEETVTFDAAGQVLKVDVIDYD